MIIADRLRLGRSLAERLLPRIIAGSLLLGPFTGTGALDGNIDYRDSRQNARAGDQTFDAYSERDALSLSQRLSLAEDLHLQARFRWLRELSGSRFTGQRLESESISHQPSLTLDYRTRSASLGVRGSWLARRSYGATARAPRDGRSEYEGWLKLRPDQATRLAALLSQTRSDEDGRVNGDREYRERLGSLDAERRLGDVWRFEYGFSGRSSDLVTRDRRRTQLSHGFELNGSPSFSSNRVNTSIRVRSRFFSQKTETGSGGETDILLVPFAGGVLLDDTPETHDPLEDDVTPIPELYDRNLDTPTGINLGDSAPVVREFGGDYRNIEYDFGDTEELSSAVLYIDTRLLLPELYEWRVFVSDDPEGRLWEEVGGDRISVQYREWGTVLQGWEIDFVAGVSGRYFKMVDVKLGSTVPDLFVTELEVFRREVTEVMETTERSQNHRLDGRIAYDVTPRLRVGYQTSLRKRVFEGEGRDLDEMSHGFTSRYGLGILLLSGRFAIHTLSSESQRNTDVMEYQLSAAQGLGRRFSNTLSWNRSVDASGSLDRTTDVLSLSTTWKAAQRLRINQRVSYGRRADDVLDARSTSISLLSAVNAQPIPSLTLDLDRTDRWVSSEVGAGFQPFNDTRFNVIWSPFPLISLSSFVNYQVRETEEWSTRQFLSWSPLPGGSVEITFSGNNFYDSRSDTSRRGAGALVKWRPHPRVMAEGNVEAQRFKVSGNTDNPVSTYVHLVWSF